jgi:hypothetical protein
MPANVNVASDVRPSIAAIREQAETVVVPRNSVSREPLWRAGDALYFEALLSSPEDLPGLVEAFVEKYNGEFAPPEPSKTTTGSP